MARNTSALATLPERVSVVEVKMENMDFKLDDLKGDVKEMHNGLIQTLTTMQAASTKQHGELAGKIKELEGIKDKWLRYTLIVLGFAAGAGWITNPSLAGLLKFVGL